MIIPRAIFFSATIAILIFRREKQDCRSGAGANFPRDRCQVLPIGTQIRRGGTGVIEAKTDDHQIGVMPGDITFEASPTVCRCLAADPGVEDAERAAGILRVEHLLQDVVIDMNRIDLPLLHAALRHAVTECNKHHRLAAEGGWNGRLRRVFPEPLLISMIRWHFEREWVRRMHNAWGFQEKNV